MSNPSPVPAASNTFERIKRVESREKKRLKAEPKKLFGNKSKAGAA